MWESAGASGGVRWHVRACEGNAPTCFRFHWASTLHCLPPRARAGEAAVTPPLAAGPAGSFEPLLGDSMDSMDSIPTDSMDSMVPDLMAAGVDDGRWADEPVPRSKPGAGDGGVAAPKARRAKAAGAGAGAGARGGARDSAGGGEGGGEAAPKKRGRPAKVKG